MSADVSGTKRRGRPWLRRSLAALAALVLLTGGVGWYFYQRFDGNITVDTATMKELLRHEDERPPPHPRGARNILLIGSDGRAGRNAGYGRDPGVQRSDTTILLHLSADRNHVTSVSLPRDLWVRIPRCRRPQGGHTRPEADQFNVAFAHGGAACTIRVVERLTDVRVDHHVIVDFTGFKKMVDAVGGVEVCLPRPMRDKAAKVSLPAGRQLLRGEDALGYVRARKTLDGGTDTARMARQQEFLRALVSKVRSSDVLLNPMRMAPLLDAATAALTTDPGLSSFPDIYGLVREVPQSEARFLTVPRRPHRLNPNRDELAQPAADKLFRALRKDRLVTFVSENRTAPGKGGATSAPSAYDGRTRTEKVCR